ncbi:hypothetical protein P2318_13285 [Myxococcaceae bacterium GXIMD 01537]
MPPSIQELLVLAGRYWRSDDLYYRRNEKSPESLRLDALWRDSMPLMESWRAMLEDLRRQRPDFTFGEITTTADTCFRCGAYPPGAAAQPTRRWAVVGCMSIIAPVYSVYAVRHDYLHGEVVDIHLLFDPLPPELRADARLLAEHIETRFRIDALPPELAALPVPLFVELKEPPHTTLFHALFSSQPTSIP